MARDKWSRERLVKAGSRLRLVFVTLGVLVASTYLASVSFGDTDPFTTLPSLAAKCEVIHPRGFPSFDSRNQVIKAVRIAYPNMTAQTIQERSNGVEANFSALIAHIHSGFNYAMGENITGELYPEVVMASNNLEEYSPNPNTQLRDLQDEIKNTRLVSSYYAYDATAKRYSVLMYTSLDKSSKFPYSLGGVNSIDGKPFGEIFAYYDYFTLLNTFSGKSQVAAIRHEKGHADGMPHNNNPRSVMNQAANFSPDAGITEDDVQGICELAQPTPTATPRSFGTYLPLTTARKAIVPGTPGIGW